MSSNQGQLYLRITLQIMFIMHSTTLLYHLPFQVRCEPWGPQNKLPCKTFDEIRVSLSDLFFRCVWGWINVHCVGSYYSNWILFLVMFCVPLVLILRVFCVRIVYRKSIFFSLVLILHICAYLGIKGINFFQTSDFFWCSFYIQIGVLQFVSPIQFYTKSSNFYTKLNVSKLYVTNLY